MRGDLHKNIKAYSAAFVAILFWSSSFPAVKYSLDYYSPEALMLLRFLIASIFLMGFCAVKKVPFPHKRDLPLFALSGLSGIFLYMWAFNAGTELVTSGISSFIIASSPVYTLIFSILFLKEKSNKLIWAGVLLSFGGIIIIGVTQVSEMRINIGFWILLFAAVSTSIYNVINKRIVQKYSAIQATIYTIVFGTIPMFVFLPNLIREFPGTPINVNLMVVYLGLFPAALAYFLWGYALLMTKKTIYVTSFLYLIPFFASVLAFFWLGETLPILAVFGGVLIAIGMVITNSRNAGD
ncbi:MAG: DMT family transporter [Defluviitaleaceae bacterium]|nr:DMT family transporter [Defluviitaleaceae bacterium]